MPEPRSAEQLVQLLRREGIHDERVLEAIRTVPREAFVEPALEEHAWANHPLSIGRGQTISQPYIVALMTELLRLEPGVRVLEVGTGSGYQTAILARLGAEVFTIERIGALAEAARAVLGKLGIGSVRRRVGDGWSGWPEEAPFDRIIVTAAPDRVPTALTEQLGPEGVMVVPVGREDEVQTLIVVTREADGSLTRREAGSVRFVPMVRQIRP